MGKKSSAEKRARQKAFEHRNGISQNNNCPKECAATRNALMFCLESGRDKTLEALQISFGKASRVATGAELPPPHLGPQIRSLAQEMGWNPV